ncbi:hypothetical protein [uncultured Enterococcus sp.]|uniref:hypothetical protein n=1 Tax=uncultured Enterococcus sp. TaxID=167972 RepID=UPI0025E335E3|nr:hypothetical protein [uncultured Enterococcus sp.]
MTTERDGAKENRRSFEEAKTKTSFEATVDKNREHVAMKKEEKAEKRAEREHK